MDHGHSLLVGIPQAVHKAGLDVQPLQHLADLRPAAVDHHHPDAHQGQQDDIGNHRLAQLLGDHSVAAIFYNDGFTGVFLNIRQGLGQYLGPIDFVEGHGSTSTL